MEMKKTKRKSVTKMLRYLYLAPVFALPFCGGGNASPLESMAEPIIVKVKNDTVTEVEDKAGKKYALTTSDRLKYCSPFVQAGDTIKLVTEK